MKKIILIFLFFLISFQISNAGILMMAYQNRLKQDSLDLVDAENGNVHKQLLCAHRFFTKQNYDETYRFVKMASDAKNDTALCLLAELYYYGFGVEQDKQKALHIIQSLKCQDTVLTNNESYREQDKKEDIKRLENGIKKGGLYNCLLGIMYYWGEVVPQNYEKAVNYFSEVTEIDFHYPVATYYLYKCYKYGRGVNKDLAKANEYLKMKSSYSSFIPFIKERKYKFTLKELELKSNTRISVGYEWIDLGLPSGLKWASCNIGANNVSEFGNYYAWGEITIPVDSNYSEKNCRLYKKKVKDIKRNSEYDVATANWKGNWRVPTADEFKELIEYCKWEWNKKGSHYGYEIIGPNGNSIFLPAGDYRDNSYPPSKENKAGCYWTSSPSENKSEYSYSLNFYYFGQNSVSNSIGVNYNYQSRYCGQLIRPVRE